MIQVPKAIILAPQNVTIENVVISRDLLETHIVMVDPNNINQWVSMNGIVGVIDPKQDRIYILSSAHHSPCFNPLTLDLKSIFQSER